MFDIGMGIEKLLFIGVIALIVVGPEDLPKVMYTVGKWIGKIRAIGQEFQDTWSGVMAAEEIKQLKEELAHTKALATSSLDTGIPFTPPSSEAERSLEDPAGRLTVKQPVETSSFSASNPTLKSD